MRLVSLMEAGKTKPVTQSEEKMVVLTLRMVTAFYLIERYKQKIIDNNKVQVLISNLLQQRFIISSDVKCANCLMKCM
jgi:hypothetical protein